MQLFFKVPKICNDRKFRDADASIFIGDSDYEIEVGRNAGILSAGVCWGAYTEERLKAAQPDYIFRNMDDLYTLIEE